jgi:hypothetical protein
MKKLAVAMLLLSTSALAEGTGSSKPVEVGKPDKCVPIGRVLKTGDLVVSMECEEAIRRTPIKEQKK